MKVDAKTLVAVSALATALAGGVELRVQVGLLASKVDRLEDRLARIEREVSPSSFARAESAE